MKINWKWTEMCSYDLIYIYIILNTLFYSSVCIKIQSYAFTNSQLCAYVEIYVQF